MTCSNRYITVALVYVIFSEFFVCASNPFALRGPSPKAPLSGHRNCWTLGHRNMHYKISEPVFSRFVQHDKKYLKCLLPNTTNSLPQKRLLIYVFRERYNQFRFDISLFGKDYDGQLTLVLYGTRSSCFYIVDTRLINKSVQGRHRILVSSVSGKNVFFDPLVNPNVEILREAMAENMSLDDMQIWATTRFKIRPVIVYADPLVHPIINYIEVIPKPLIGPDGGTVETGDCPEKAGLEVRGYMKFGVDHWRTKVCIDEFVSPSDSSPERRVEFIFAHSQVKAELYSDSDTSVPTPVLVFVNSPTTLLRIDTRRLGKRIIIETLAKVHVVEGLSSLVQVNIHANITPVAFIQAIRDKYGLSGDVNGSSYFAEFARFNYNSPELVVKVTLSRYPVRLSHLDPMVSIRCETGKFVSVSVPLKALTYLNLTGATLSLHRRGCQLKSVDNRNLAQNLLLDKYANENTPKECIVTEDSLPANKMNYKLSFTMQNSTFELTLTCPNIRIVAPKPNPTSAVDVRPEKSVEVRPIELKVYTDENLKTALENATGISVGSPLYAAVQSHGSSFFLNSCSLAESCRSEKGKNKTSSLKIFEGGCLREFPVQTYLTEDSLTRKGFHFYLQPDISQWTTVCLRCTYTLCPERTASYRNPQAYLCGKQSDMCKLPNSTQPPATPTFDLTFGPILLAEDNTSTVVVPGGVPIPIVVCISCMAFILGIFLTSSLWFVHARTKRQKHRLSQQHTAGDAYPLCAVGTDCAAACSFRVREPGSSSVEAVHNSDTTSDGMCEVSKMIGGGELTRTPLRSPETAYGPLNA